jgi:hypothetical protein
MKMTASSKNATRNTTSSNTSGEPQDGLRGNQSASGGPPDRAVANLELSRITVDADLQCRAEVDEATVTDYAGRMKAGDAFPPLVVFDVDGQCLLVDGWHRHPAALKAGLTEFPVEVHQGTRNDALRYALQANATHGLPRTNRDKRRAVALAVDEFPKDSDRAIADLCKVSHVFVGNIRRELETVTSSVTRLGRDGKKRKLPKKRSLSDAKPRKPTNPQSGGNGGHAKPGDSAQSDDGRQESNPAARTGEASERFSFWEEWSSIEDALNAAVKKCPDERWRRELTSRLYKFADLRCL